MSREERAHLEARPSRATPAARRAMSRTSVEQSVHALMGSLAPVERPEKKNGLCCTAPAHSGGSSLPYLHC